MPIVTLVADNSVALCSWMFSSSKKETQSQKNIKLHVGQMDIDCHPI